ncbi:MAG: three-Cys-motif partner protein TcmP [Nitrospirae bacterium]|nr:three-Cys-motif partner protein TcmP [Nitrospirota bacterium]
MRSFSFDEIGYWTEIKLEIIRKYAVEYSKILAAQRPIRRHVYIDAFAGAGHHMSKRSGRLVAGSPLNALDIQPPFSELHFIDLHGGKAGALRKLAGDRNDVFVHEEDANTVLLRDCFRRCRFEDYSRGLCILDPYSIAVDWKILATAGKMKSVEVFYSFMIMDANMNVLWTNPDKVAKNQAIRLDAVWGDRSWRSVAYPKSRGLFGEMEEKAGNEEIAEAFRKRLIDVAGFKFAPKPMPMRNSKGAVVYYLYFASPNRTGAKIVKSIFDKYRSMGIR